MLQKRIFDVTLAIFSLSLLAPVLLVMAAIAAADTRSSGFFRQQRVGQHGKLFTITKLRSMHAQTGTVSSFGRFLRRSKIDELPQLYHIIIGDMSFVGPRPDIPGYYDTLQGEARKLLLLKPGLTSEASLKYHNEDALLAAQENPLHYNDTVLFPDKVRMNLEYLEKRSFIGDLHLIWRTLHRW